MCANFDNNSLYDFYIIVACMHACAACCTRSQRRTREEIDFEEITARVQADIARQKAAGTYFDAASLAEEGHDDDDDDDGHEAVMRLLGGQVVESYEVDDGSSAMSIFEQLQAMQGRRATQSAAPIVASRQRRAANDRPSFIAPSVVNAVETVDDDDVERASRRATRAKRAPKAIDGEVADNETPTPSRRRSTTKK